MSEIFRHLRPVWYDSIRAEILPMKNGGISFYLQPVNDSHGAYYYWIYICPMEIPFSSKSAVKALRDRSERKVAPWGKIQINDDPLILQLLKSLMAESDLPSHASKMAFDIVMTIWAAESKKEAANNKSSQVLDNVLNAYKD